MPVIPLFDFFTGGSVGFNGSVTLFEHDVIRPLAQNPARPEPYFSHFQDFDAIYVQYSGTSVVGGQPPAADHPRCLRCEQGWTARGRPRR